MQIVSIEGTASLPLLAWSQATPLPGKGKAKPAAKKAAPANKATNKKGGAKKK